jgi:hypothetical protein
MQQHHIEKMPRFTATKQVRALKIASISTAELGKVKLVFADNYFPPAEVDEGMIAGGMPSEGDYFMIEDDGAQRIAPARVFEQWFKPAP